MKSLQFAFKRCKQTKTSFTLLVLSYIKYKLLYNKNFLVHPNAKIFNVKNINTTNQLSIGLNNTGHSHQSDKTVLNVEGKLNVAGKYSIGRGCRIYIRKGAVVNIGRDGYMNNDTELNIAHGVNIGDNTVMAWKCQLLDTDFHTLNYEGKKEKNNVINIGNNVWIGCNVHIYKGSTIPNNCVVAADSIIRGVFEEENCLIGGNPAKILKRNISWHL